MSHKIDLKINTRYLFLTKDKKGHYIMSKGSILKEDITIVNIYALNMEKTMATGTYISIITLNINGLNVPTKRHRLAKWLQK